MGSRRCFQSKKNHHKQTLLSGRRCGCCSEPGWFICVLKAKGECHLHPRIFQRAERRPENQVEFLRTFCNARGVIVQKCIEDIGSGLNYNRPKWNRLLEDVMDGKIDTIYITHKDRFIRFGYSWFERLCRRFKTEIVVVVNESLSPMEEMVQDIIAIIHLFSCRIYGMRKYKDEILKDAELVPDPDRLEEAEISEDWKGERYGWQTKALFKNIQS